MPRITVVRPTWRRFHEQHLSRGAAWVQSGGHAAVVSARGRVDMLLTTDDKGKITEQGYWALLAVEQQRWRRVTDGPAKGMATARVADDFVEAVLDWCDRDATYASPTRRLRLDCLECGACCHESFVVLYDEDLDRFKEGKRRDLLGKDYIKRTRDGRTVLRFLKKDGGACQHLEKDNKCRIYPLRPFNCRVFPVGSEACLAARESTFGWRDGVAAPTSP